MSEKIVVNPSEIRGWGNVLKEKQNADFTKYHCTVNQSSVTQDGFTRNSFYINGYMPAVLELTSQLEDWYNSFDSVSVQLKLSNVRGAKLNNMNVKCYKNNTLYSTKKTNSNGIVTFTISDLTRGQCNVRFVFETTTLYEGVSVSDGFYVGVNITLSQSNEYYWSEEYAALTATVKKYGLNTPYEGLCSYRLVDQSDSSNVITFNNVAINSNGVATLNQQIPTPGHYSWTVTVGNDTSSASHVYIVDFREEFDDFLVWYLACIPTRSDAQYEGTIDIRTAFDEYLQALYRGVIDPTYDITTIEQIDNVMVGLHAYYNE